MAFSIFSIRIFDDLIICNFLVLINKSVFVTIWLTQNNFVTQNLNNDMLDYFIHTSLVFVLQETCQQHNLPGNFAILNVLEPVFYD